MATPSLAPRSGSWALTDTGGQGAPAGEGRARLVLVAVVGLAFGAAMITLKAVYGGPGHSQLDILADAVAGALFLTSGLYARTRPGERRIGTLLVATGFAWFAEDSGFLVLASHSYWLWAVGTTLATFTQAASTGVLAHLALAFPGGRLRSRLERLLVAAAYVEAFVLVPLGDRNCCVGHYVQIAPGAAGTFQAVAVGFGAALAAAIAWVLGRRWLASSVPQRRVLAPFFAVGLVSAGAQGVGLFTASGHPGQWLHTAPLVVGTVAFILLPPAFLLGLLRLRLARAAVGELVLDLGDAPSLRRLRDALARALGDPRLVVARRVAGADRYEDDSGVEVRLPEAGGAMRATPIERDGISLGAIVHDAALTDDDGLLAAATRATYLALEQQQMRDDARGQLAELAESRRRIVEAGDEARKRLERDLHDGAQQRLVSLVIALGEARGRRGDADDPELDALLAQAAQELTATLSELRELALGLHPQALVEQGLAGAIRSVAQRAPFPVRVHARLDAEPPEATRTTAYFVVCEALTNAAKHAGAAHAEIKVERRNGSLRVEVADDGCGGADPAGGSGIEGLRQRVEATGGAFELASPIGAGTRLRATLPCV